MRAQELRVVGAAVVAFASTAMVLLLLYRPLAAPDEQAQLDRIMAAADGRAVILDPDGLRFSKRGQALLRLEVARQHGPDDPSIADVSPVPRDRRPSLAELGSTRRSPAAPINYLGNHPPLYYLLMGGALDLLPGAFSMPADQLFFWLRLLDVLLVLPLPVLAWATARKLGARPEVAAAAAWLPLLVPALVRDSVALNNDNLAILLGTLLLYGVSRALRGDLGARTASWLGLVCVAGALTKATFVLLLPLVLVAYLTGLARSRRGPPWRTVLVLLVAAAASSGWYVRDWIVFGSPQPASHGAPWLSAFAQPRTAATPFRASEFWSYVWQNFPDRYWGALGVLEPPWLPRWVAVGLTLLVLGGILVALVTERGRRWDLALMWFTAAGLILAVLMVTMGHNRHYLALPGLQGRYAHPAVLGLLLPVAFAVGRLLPRRWRWTAPAWVALPAVALQAVAVTVVVGHYWVGTGRRLTPGTAGEAGHRLLAFAPFAPPTVTLLVLLAVAGGGASLWLLLSGVGRGRTSGSGDTRAAP